MGSGEICLHPRLEQVNWPRDVEGSWNLGWWFLLLLLKLFACLGVAVFEVPQRIHFWCSLCTLYLPACRVSVTVAGSGLCCCTCVTSLEH